MPVVNREVVLPVDRERAWELITEPAELEGWLADEVEFAPEEDAPLRVTDGGETREGVVEHVTDEERIVFTWGDSMVEWVLEDHPAGTRFVVTEHRFADDGAVWGPTMSALAGELPITRQAVAKHLAALQRAGLVEPHREGRETRYTLTPAPLADAMRWMDDVGAEWDARLAKLAERR